MRTAGLDFDPMARPAPVTMTSPVPQPFYVTTGRTRHPAEEPTSETPKLPINVDWRLVLQRLPMTDEEIGAATGRGRRQAGKWRRGVCAPPADATHELALLWGRRVGGPLPGQWSPGSSGAAIPAVTPKKRGRPSKADLIVRAAAQHQLKAPA